MTRGTLITRIAAPVALLLAMASASPSGNGRRFFDDDPISREPDSQNAAGVKPWDIDLFWDLAENMFSNPGDPRSGVAAGNVNTIDEVPDSSWFTNRILARPLSIDEIVRGPLTGTGPAAGKWQVIRPKQAGAAPGFTMTDAAGETWFVSFDADGFPEAATGAIGVATRIFWALGYWQVENHLVSIRPDQLGIAPTASVTPPSGKKRPMKVSDIEAVLKRAHRAADGSYRAIAARAVPGTPLGGFRYHDTRPDDPNDVVPHEHRRELRALKVFGAWTNLVDIKAGNTLDTLITVDGRSTVRHYLQDVGSTFGTGAIAPHQYDEGWEYLHDGGMTMKRLFTLNFLIRPWQTVDYEKNLAIGRFEGKAFDPLGWKPRVGTAAFRRARGDDNFWAARRVMAFSDEMIRAMVDAGQYSDPAARKLLGDVLIERRDKIGKTYLTAINPVINVALSPDGVLSFENAAVAAGVAAAPAGGYTITWARFDNATGAATELATATAAAGARMPAPAPLPSDNGTYLKLDIRAVQPANASWAEPVSAFFRRIDGAWKLVGLQRVK